MCVVVIIQDTKGNSNYGCHGSSSLDFAIDLLVLLLLMLLLLLLLVFFDMHIPLFYLINYWIAFLFINEGKILCFVVTGKYLFRKSLNSVITS